LECLAAAAARRWVFLAMESLWKQHLRVFGAKAQALVVLAMLPASAAKAAKESVKELSFGDR
jgi:hypothetical protein